MIVITGGIKGGSGKSTVATNLAVIRAMQGRDVLLVDTDDQETATDFTNQRKALEKELGERAEAAGRALGGMATYTSIKLTGPAVRTETLQLAPKYDDIIIDTGGRDTTSQRAALSVGHVLLVPFAPRSFDLWTVEKVAELVTEMRQANAGLKAFTFINKADPVGSDNGDTAQALAENDALQFLDMPLGARKAFGNAAAKGLSVIELKPEDAKAIEEINRLSRYVFDIKEISIEYQKRA